MRGTAVSADMKTRIVRKGFPVGWN